jgi:hypothetical protein
MEDVLEVYVRPYDPLRPHVCLDETQRATGGRNVHSAADGVGGNQLGTTMSTNATA